MAFFIAVTTIPLGFIYDYFGQVKSPVFLCGKGDEDDLKKQLNKPNYHLIIILEVKMNTNKKARKGLKAAFALLLALIMTIGAIPHEVFAATTENALAPSVITEPVIVTIAGEEVELPPDGIVTVEAEGQLMEMEIPRYLYIAGELLSIDDERIEDITPVIMPTAPFAIGLDANDVPSVTFIVALNLTSIPVPDGPIVPPANPYEHEFGGATLHLTTGSTRMRISSRRYFVHINGMSYEVYCANPNLPGPGAGIIYVMTGTQADQFRTVLRYGHPHNPHGNNLDTSARSWFQYMTRVAVGYVGNPGATIDNANGDPLTSAQQSILNQLLTGTYGSAPASLANNPPITVNGPSQSSDHQTGVTPQSPQFEIGHNRRSNCGRNLFNFVWDATTPAGTRLYVNGSYVATAPANPAEVFRNGGTSSSITLVSDLHFVMPVGSEGQTAAVDMVGVNNPYAGRVFVMQHSTNPTGFQDIVFYIHPVEARASYTWEETTIEHGRLRIIKTDMQSNNLGGAEFTINGPDASMPMTVIVGENGWTSGPLVPGTYTITEITPPAGFSLASNPTQTVEVTENHTSSAPAIVTFQNEPTTTPTPTPRPPLLNQAAIPLLVSAMANTTAVISGEPIIVSVRTNTYARHVWAVVDSVRVEAVAGATSNNIRSWVITVVPNETQVIDVFASAATGPVRLANRRIPVMVEHEAVTINRAQAQIQTVGDQIPRQVIVTIVTNRSAEWVDVLVPGMNASLPATKRQTQGNEVIWTLTYTPTSGWLEHPIRIFAGEDRHGTGDSRILTRFES